MILVFHPDTDTWLRQRSREETSSKIQSLNMQTTPNDYRELFFNVYMFNALITGILFCAQSNIFIILKYHIINNWYKEQINDH